MMGLREEIIEQNSLWSILIIEELYRCGIEYICISPGSRSTLLTMAAGSHPHIKTIICLDERTAAFHALGYAKGSGKAAVVITTSGTAVANCHPAVIEAYNDEVPLIILSADRPPELLQNGANQSINQKRMFGDNVNWYFEFPCPNFEIPAQFILQKVDQAYFATYSNNEKGPVHLNFPFREPLLWSMIDHNQHHYLSTLEKWMFSKRPFTQYVSHDKIIAGEVINDLIKELVNKRVLLVLANIDLHDDGKEVLKLIEKMGWSVICDVQCSLRFMNFKGHIFHSESYINHNDFLSSQQYDIVLQLGSRLISKKLINFLKTRDAAYLLVSQNRVLHDSNYRVQQFFKVDPSSFISTLLCKLDENKITNTTMKTVSITSAINEEIDNFLSQNKINEIFVIRNVIKNLPHKEVVFVANSMPVRDLNQYAPIIRKSILVCANRGASGIDGLIASACGFSIGKKSNVTLIIGDLSFLHDIGSLDLLNRINLKIILINNNGGGIFSFLPIATNNDKFTEFFSTPHKTKFEYIAKAYDIDYKLAQTTTEFNELLKVLYKEEKSMIIEVVTNKKENLALHQELEKKINNRGYL